SFACGRFGELHLLEELLHLAPRRDGLVMPLDVVLGGEPENYVAQPERGCRGQHALGRSRKAVAQEDQAVGLDADHARVGAVVATHVTDIERYTPELDLDPVVEDDVGESNFDRS